MVITFFLPLQQRENLEQSQKLEDLEQLVSKLAKSKDKTSRQLQGVKRDLHLTETEAKEEKAKSSSNMNQLARELASVKETLEETRAREKQVKEMKRIYQSRFMMASLKS